MNVPNVVPGAPMVMPGLPAGGSLAPIATLNMQAARGARSVLGCPSCGTNGYSGPSLGDIDSGGVPTWAKILGVMAFVGVIVTVANVAAKRRH